MTGGKLSLAQLRDGQRIELSASEAERAAIAGRLDLLGLDRLEATLTLARDGQRILAEGRLRAAVTQACVATGEPVPAMVDEKVALAFLPEPSGTPDEELELSGDDLDVIFHDGREIDLLTAREFQQQVERSLEPVDVDQEGRLGVGLVDLHDFVEWQFPRHESRLRTPKTQAGAETSPLGTHRKR